MLNPSAPMSRPPPLPLVAPPPYATSNHTCTSPGNHMAAGWGRFVEVGREGPEKAVVLLGTSSQRLTVTGQPSGRLGVRSTLNSWLGRLGSFLHGLKQKWNVWWV